MNTIELLDKLYNSGDLRLLIQAGLLTTNAFNWRKVYHSFNERIESGRSVPDAVKDVSEIFGQSERTTYRIIRKMKKPASFED